MRATVELPKMIERSSDRLRVSDLDLSESFRARPLPAQALRCLGYMHDVEYHTVCYLRDLLLTPAHSDPEVTAFLSMWVYQEYWHGEALAAVLAAHGEEAGHSRVASVRDGLGLRDRLRPILMSLGGWAGGRDFMAVHMAWGAINEWMTQAGYARLSKLAGHPALSELLGRIMRQEGRHIDFYATQAARRLGESARARHLTRSALRRCWRPVGSGLM
ncbi:MAG: ferritin-like domain-containing protein, partial [Acidimicrobiales bacterium]